MVQTVAELVEQGRHFIMGKQCRLAVYRAVKVAGQVSDRFLQAAIGFSHLANAIIHPRPTALVFTRVQVKIEATARLTAFVEQVEEAHVRMVNVNIVALFRGNAVDAFHYFKQAAKHSLFREIGAQLLVADSVQVLLLFLTKVGQIQGCSSSMPYSFSQRYAAGPALAPPVDGHVLPDRSENQ